MAIYFYPVAPTILSTDGTYMYDDFTWNELLGGNLRAYYLFDYWVCGYFSSDSGEKAKNITDFALIAGKSYRYNDDKVLLFFGKNEISVPDNYFSELKNMIAAMKSVGESKYFKDTSCMKWLITMILSNIIMVF